MKIYNLDGKTPVDIEDIMGLFIGAGLPIGNGLGVSSSAQNNDLNSISSSPVGNLNVEDEIEADLQDEDE